MINRAAQFSPFAALTGYEGQVQEAARLTDRMISLSDTEKEQLDGKLQAITALLDTRPTVSITYFVPDAKKAGGSYNTATGTFKKIDAVEREVVFYAGNGISDGERIAIDRIAGIESRIFQQSSDI